MVSGDLGAPVTRVEWIDLWMEIEGLREWDRSTGYVGRAAEQGVHPNELLTDIPLFVVKLRATVGNKGRDRIYGIAVYPNNDASASAGARDRLGRLFHLLADRCPKARVDLRINERSGLAYVLIGS